MILAKILAAIAVLLLLAVLLLIRADKRKRILIVEPTWRNAECIGDGACNWAAQRSARISKMQEPWGM